MNPTPRAVSHFGLAALEARAARTRRALAPAAAAKPPARLQPRPDGQLQPRRFTLRLWLPLTAIFLVLAPFAILLIPFCYLAPPLRGMNCAAAVFAIGRMLLSLGGTDIQIDAPAARLRIKIL